MQEGLKQIEIFPGYCYCIDTSALVDLKELYIRDTFPSLWKSIENLISQGRIIAPREVLEELKRYGDKDDELLRLAKKHKKMFKDLDYEQQQQLRNILRDFPDLPDVDKMTPDADPLIIALAICKGCAVITSEKPANPGARPKIPNACEKYNVKCISLIEFFIEQKWKF